MVHSFFPSQLEVVAALILICGFESIRVQEGPPQPTLDSLKLEYDVNRSELMRPIAELQKIYEGKLKELLDEVTSAGELKEALAVKAELETYKNPTGGEEGEEKPATFPELQRLQEIFVDSKEKRLVTAREELKPLKDAYQEKLLALQKQLTQEQKLDQAVEVQTVIQEVEASRSELVEGNMAEMEEAVEDVGENLLQGKTISFPHSRNKDFTINVEFHRDGKATWVGLGYHEVPWLWEVGHTPLVYYFWSEHQSTKETGMMIKLEPDGRTGTVSHVNGNQPTPAEVGRRRK